MILVTIVAPSVYQKLGKACHPEILKPTRPKSGADTFGVYSPP